MASTINNIHADADVANTTPVGTNNTTPAGTNTTNNSPSTPPGINSATAAPVVADSLGGTPNSAAASGTGATAEELRVEDIIEQLKGSDNIGKCL